MYRKGASWGRGGGGGMRAWRCVRGKEAGGGGGVHL